MGQPLRAEFAAPIPSDRRQDPQVRRKLSAPAARTFFNIAAKWNLTIHEQRGLLGWPAESTLHKYKGGQVATLSYDILMRISLVIGIYSALKLLYPEPALADGWVKLPNTNPLFGGRPALGRMIDGGMDGLYRVRRLLDSRRGGWN